jgi:hypothetical protein
MAEWIVIGFIILYLVYKWLREKSKEDNGRFG